MRDINKVIIIGRLVRDPELKYTPGGTKVTEFSIASNSDYKGKDGQMVKSTVYVICQAWTRLAEVLCEYGRKGGRMAIEGRLGQDSWSDKDTGKSRSRNFVVVENFQFLSSKKDQGGNGDDSEKSSGGDVPLMDHGSPADAGDFNSQKPFSDDDIPF